MVVKKKNDQEANYMYESADDIINMEEEELAISRYAFDRGTTK